MAGYPSRWNFPWWERTCSNPIMPSSEAILDRWSGSSEVSMHRSRGDKPRTDLHESDSRQISSPLHSQKSTACDVAVVSRLWLPAVTVLWTLLMAAPCLWAQGAKPTDYDVKAVYLYNFGRFVEWPASVTSKSDSFTVCVLGQDPFGPALDATLADETIGGKNRCRQTNLHSTGSGQLPDPVHEFRGGQPA